MEDWEEGCSGLYKNIRWLESVPIQENYDAAQNYIEKHDSGCYDQLAVRYYDHDSSQTSKKLLELKERAQKLYEKWNSMDKKIHYANAKSQYISCKNCGSKLNTRLLV